MMTALNDVTRYEVIDRIAVITIDSPPVNALSHAVRTGLAGGINRARADVSVEAIVITCAGKTFFAGADITEFNGAPKLPDLLQVVAQIEGSPKPVVAAIHGTALGGGLETALACHYRVAVASAKLGLPEVNLGLLPGAGGTQRLPRLLGPIPALEMMVSGKPVSGGKAKELGLVDEIVEEGMLVQGSVSFARRAIDESLPLRRVRDLEVLLHPARDNPKIFADFRSNNAKVLRGFKAPENIIKAVEAAVSLPFEEGMKREAELFVELVTSVESAAQRHMFFAQRAATKVPGIGADVPVQKVQSVSVIGAGTMGGGIAMNFLNIGLPVTIVERSQEALDRGVAVIRKNYDASAAKGRIRAEDVEARMGRLKLSQTIDDLGESDLIIEAVFENLDLKKDIFARLDTIAKADAILASNTSFLDLDAIATATTRPERVIGLHFFSPANVMPLLEIVRGEKTSPELIASAMKIGRDIGKTVVLSRVCDGFIANRAMAVRSTQANRLIQQGPMPWEIDEAMSDFGFPMGPFAMTDLVGLDVIGWNPETSASSTVLEVLCEMGRWGQKKGAGYYDYDDKRRGVPSPVAEKVIRDFAAKQGFEQRRLSFREIVAELLYPVVNEGARILEEGVAIRASDIDVALTTGYGWPVYTGGPMFWADTVGLATIVDALENMALDDSSLAPCELLRRLVRDKKALHSYVVPG
jgi:3-hydroxyacyl-CoA dehydrogenase